MKQFLCVKLAELELPNLLVVTERDREAAKKVLIDWLKERYTAAMVMDDIPLLNCLVMTELPSAAEAGVQVIQET